MKKGLPRLAWWAGKAPQNAGDGALGNGDAEHLQLAMDPRCTPEGVGDRHLFDQSANLHGGCGPPSTTTVRFGQVCPESTEPFTMPAGDCVRLEIEQRTAPAGPPSSEGDPEQPIQGSEDRSLMLALDAASWRRRAAFSIATAWWPLIKSRKKRKTERKKAGICPDCFAASQSESTSYERTG